MLVPSAVESSQLSDIADKVYAGVRLTQEDGVRLYESNELLVIGRLGNFVREKLHGKNAYFNVNRHIEPTNVCILKCGLCAFGKNLRSPEAYTFSLDEIFRRAEEGAAQGATEFQIVGGLHPDLPFQYYLDMLQGLKQRLPHVHLKAFTAVEVEFFSDLEKISIEETLQRLKDSGLDSMPGGGAEIFAERVREIICKGKISGERRLEIVRIAHRMGLHSKQPCYTVTLKPMKNEWSICSLCATFRMKRVDSKHLSRSHFIPRIRPLIICRKQPVSMISRISPYPACCLIIFRISSLTGSWSAQRSLKCHCSLELTILTEQWWKKKLRMQRALKLPRRYPARI